MLVTYQTNCQKFWLRSLGHLLLFVGLTSILSGRVESARSWRGGPANCLPDFIPVSA